MTWAQPQKTPWPCRFHVALLAEGGAALQRVKCSCLLPSTGLWGSSSQQADNLWKTWLLSSELWPGSDGIQSPARTQMHLRCVKNTRSAGSPSIGFGIRMSQLDARMCKIMSQTAPCWSHIWGSLYALFIPANAWNILCLLNVFPKC